MQKSRGERLFARIARQQEFIDYFDLRWMTVGDLVGPCDFEVGDAGEVVIRLSSTHIEVRLFSVEWNSHVPEPTSEPFVKVRWTKLPEDPDKAREALRHLIESARIARRAQFRECRYCREMIPPEHLHDGNVCHGCAERYLGIVH